MATVEIVIKGVDEASGAFTSIKSGLESVSGAAAQAQGAGGGFFSHLVATAGGFLASNVIGGITSQFSGLVSGMISGNAEFERYQTQFTTLLGSADAAKSRLADLAAFGAATPFELPEVVVADKQLQAFGLEADNAKQKFGFAGSEIRTIAGDVAAGTGAKFADIAGYIGKFASGATGEAISRFQELGIVTREQLTGMGLQFSKAGQLLSPLPEATQVILTAMKQKFGGLMDAQSQTFEGMVSNLQDWIGQTTRLIGQPIFEALKDKLGVLLTFLGSPEVKVGLNAFAQALAGGVKQAIDAAVRGFESLKTGWTTVSAALASPAAQGALTALGSAFNVIKTAASSVMSVIGGNLGPALAAVGAIVTASVAPAMIAGAVALGGLVVAAAPVIAVMGAVGVAGAALYAAWQSDFGGIREVTSTCFIEIKNVVTTVMTAVTAFWSANGATITSVAKQVWALVPQIFGAGIASILGIVTGVLQLLQGHWSQGLNTLASVTRPILDGLISVCKTILAGLAVIFSAAMDSARTAVVGFVGRFTSAGGEIINGLVQGVKNGVGALTSAVKDAALSALNAAKSALGIHSPSREADEQIGQPFVQGIVQGITRSSGLITKVARTLSKQLTDEMKKVAEEAAKAFEQVLQDQLGAAVGIDRTNMSNVRAISDIRGEDNLSNLQSQKSDLQDAQEQRQADVQRDADERAQNHQDRLDDINTDALRKKQDYDRKVKELNDKAAADDLERQQKIQDVQNSAGWAEDKAAKIAAINADYDQKGADRKKSMDDLSLSRSRELEDIQKSINDENLSYAKAQQKAQDDLNTATAEYQKKLADIENHIQNEITREQARGTAAVNAQNELAEAAQQAADIRKTDAAAADKYYQMRSQQIIETGKLQADLAEADASGDGAKANLIRQQLQMLGQTHLDEAALFKEQQKTDSPYAGLVNSLTDVRDKLLAEMQHDVYFRDMNDQNSNSKDERERWAKVNNEVVGDQNALNSIQNLLDQVASGISAGVATGVGGDTSLVDAIKASMQAAVDAAKQALGIHSPSKVFEEEVGAPSGDGIAKGLTKSIPKMTSTIAKMATEGAQAARGAVAGVVGGSSTAHSSASHTTKIFNLTIHTNSGDAEDIASQFRQMEATLAGT